MLETRVENNRRFSLLSSDLAEISRALTSRFENDRNFKIWIGGMDLSVFETDIFDEKFAFEVAEYLMKRLHAFGHSMPIPALKLEAHYKEAQAGGDDYWRFALKAQQDRLSGTVKGIPPIVDLERQLRNVKRGLGKASDVLAVESDLGNQLAILARRINTKIQKPGWLQSPDSAHDVVGGFAEEINRKITAVYNKILDMEEAEADLNAKIELRKFVDEIIEATRETLLNIGKKDIAPKIHALRKPTPEIVEKAAAKKRETSAPLPIDKDKPKTEAKDGFDNLEITKAKLSQLIEAARASGNKLKILVPPEGRLRVRFEQQWNGVLSKMGFDGSVEFVVYEDLKRTTDTKTPLIVFKGMNTHGNLWNRARFESVSVIDMTPLLIMNSL